jgi:hypothetical protein
MVLSEPLPQQQQRSHRHAECALGFNTVTGQPFDGAPGPAPFGPLHITSFLSIVVVFLSYSPSYACFRRFMSILSI